MTRLMMVTAASLLAVVLTGCGEKENKPGEPAATTTTAPAAAEAPAPAPAATDEHKPAEQGH